MTIDHSDNERAPFDGIEGGPKDETLGKHSNERDNASGKIGNGAGDHPAPPRQKRFRNADGYPFGEQEWGKEVDRYIYDDADGKPYGMVKKMEPKKFPQYHYEWVVIFAGDERNWVIGAPERPILYNLFFILKLPPGSLILVTEGEKDADTAVDLLFEATCNAGGAAISKDDMKGWDTAEFKAPLAGHHIILLEDNDSSGRKHVANIAHELKGVAASVKIIRFREFTKKGFDLSDFFELRKSEGKTNAEIHEEILKRAVPYVDLDDIKDDCERDQAINATIEELLVKRESFDRDSRAYRACKDEAIELFAKHSPDYRGDPERKRMFRNDWGLDVPTFNKRMKEEDAKRREETRNSEAINNFIMNDEGLHYLNHEGAQHFVCALFEVRAKVRDPNGSDWGLLLRFRDSDGRTREQHVSMKDMHADADSLCAGLAADGLVVRHNEHKKLAAYLCELEVKERGRIVKKTGWLEINGQRAFILPQKIIGEIEGETIVPINLKGKHASRGTLDEWTNDVAALVKGHRVPMVITASAFVGPLLEPTGEESGGIHMQAPSASGKTTLNSASASVWGSGALVEGFMKDWKSTGNGIESEAVNANDTCLVLDEINSGDSRTIAAAAYQLANGKGKNRMNRDLTLRDAASWRVWTISSGEHTIEQKISEHGDKVMAGQLARFIDVAAEIEDGCGVFDSGTKDEGRLLSERICSGARQSYGTAGPEFVRRLVEMGRDEISRQWGDYREAFLQRCFDKVEKASEQAMRVAKKFALIAFAGKLAIGFGLLPFDLLAFEKAARWMFRRWIVRRGGEAASEKYQAIAQVQLMMEQHSDSRFQEVTSNGLGFPVPNRLGFRKGEGDSREYWILPETWRMEFCKGFDPKAVAKWLADEGLLLKPVGERGYQFKRDLGGGRGNWDRVYVLTNAIVGYTPRDREKEIF